MFYEWKEEYICRTYRERERERERERRRKREKENTRARGLQGREVLVQLYQNLGYRQRIKVNIFLNKVIII